MKGSRIGGEEGGLRRRKNTCRQSGGGRVGGRGQEGEIGGQ